MSRKASAPQIELDYTNMLAAAMSARRGITATQWRRAERSVAELHKRMSGRSTPGFRSLLKDEETPRRVRAYARKVKGRFRDGFVLGIGGSALGTRALAGALLLKFNRS